MTLNVFHDRVEIMLKRRTQTLEMSEIAEVYVSRRPKKLVIVTTAGKNHQLLLGQDVEMARGAIHAQLAAASPPPRE
jgi:hypothetical protein